MINMRLAIVDEPHSFHAAFVEAQRATRSRITCCCAAVVDEPPSVANGVPQGFWPAVICTVLLRGARPPDSFGADACDAGTSSSSSCGFGLKGLCDAGSGDPGTVGSGDLGDAGARLVPCLSREGGRATMSLPCGKPDCYLHCLLCL